MMFARTGIVLVDWVATFFVVLLLARFLLQWLRVSFRNPVGEFLIATTNWMVMPARRVIPSLSGLDTSSLLLAFLLQLIGLWLQAMIASLSPSALALVAVTAVDLARFLLYILVFAVIVQVIFSWVNPDAPLAPVFDAITRPFLRPIRRYVPPVGRVDLSPAILFLILQGLLYFVVTYVHPAAVALG
jgi:YggT family protein